MEPKKPYFIIAIKCRRKDCKDFKLPLVPGKNIAYRQHFLYLHRSGGVFAINLSRYSSDAKVVASSWMCERNIRGVFSRGAAREWEKYPNWFIIASFRRLKI